MLSILKESIVQKEIQNEEDELLIKRMEDDRVRDMYLDMNEDVTLGSENDDEVEKLVNSIPEDADEEDIEKVVENISIGGNP